MNRKLIALLTALLLLLISLPALAEEAGAVTTRPAEADGFVPAPFVPMPEDFLGTWTVLYEVVDGVAESAVTGMTFTIHDDNTMTSVYFSGASSIPYAITGDMLTVGDVLCRSLPRTCWWPVSAATAATAPS